MPRLEKNRWRALSKFRILQSLRDEARLRKAKLAASVINKGRCRKRACWEKVHYVASTLFKYDGVLISP